ncbi:low temperature requirement protein A [Actinocorallia populi]|uniref:low temperature requirement protein A n=1 Tax=Actinocorallia populi TaxID=2079200 RepID=UPI001E401E8F|nr:low temperature requirement protein A [Actinocorallia populi]
MRDRTAATSTKVSFFELFFDLVFVFAVTQLSHRLLGELTPGNALQTGLLLLAVWWCWMYTTWATNWFDPDHPVFRMVLTGVMLAGLLMATAIPEAFEERALWFALGYTAVQVGRTLYGVLVTRGTPLGPTFQRILCWFVPSCALWIAGGTLGGTALVALWVAAALIDLAGPSSGYFVPGLGRSATSDWSSIDGAHMAERCQLFVIIALGESVLLTGVTYAKHPYGAAATAAFALAFLSSVAFWWIYFDRTAEASAEAIATCPDPGRVGRNAYTYGHLPIVAGIIVAAVADELVIAHPTGHTTAGTAAAVLGGAGLFLTGHLLFTRTVFGHWSRPRLTALALLAALAFAHPLLSPILLAFAALLVLAMVPVWDLASSRRTEEPEVDFD